MLQCAKYRKKIDVSNNIIRSVLLQIGSGRGQVSAFPRQLESLIRIAEAHAKIRLAEKVEVKDVEEAYR